jgi:hypothetical protein
MSNAPTLTIAGDNDLASEAAQHAISSGIGDPVYLWRSIEDPLVSKAPVVILADPPERAGFARVVLDAGLTAVTLPLQNPEQNLQQAILDGQLRQMSRLHGLPTIARLQSDVHSGAPGRRYGVFAAHRIPANFADDLEEVVDELITCTCSLIDAPVTRISATRSDLGTSTTAGWFILARFADDTIATIEAAAVLPESDDPSGELLIEVTGSNAVLRAAPEQQGVVVNTASGGFRSSWYAEPSEFLMRRAQPLLERDDRVISVSAMNLIRRRVEAAQMEQALEL